MTITYDLTQLDSHSFEHMVNFLAMKKLGSGITGFVSGPDGGRDGYLKGKAPYPTTEDCWEGIWYIQSKFHKPNLSTNAQKWLIREVIKEIKSYSNSNHRVPPDIWIIATNIEPSGQPQTGAYDKIISLVKKYSPKIKVDVWGGRKILDFLLFGILYEIASDKNEQYILRASSLSLLLHHQLSDKAKTIENFFVNNLNDLCIELYSSHCGQLISHPLFSLLHDVVNIDAKLQEFVGKYFSISRSNFPSRIAMQHIIAKWRERSGSVVHNSGKLESWLSE